MLGTHCPEGQKVALAQFSTTGLQTLSSVVGQLQAPPVEVGTQAAPLGHLTLQLVEVRLQRGPDRPAGHAHW